MSVRLWVSTVNVVFDTMDYLDANRVNVKYYMPLSKLFLTSLISEIKYTWVSSLDYELSGYRQSELVKIDILLNNEVDAELHCAS